MDLIEEIDEKMELANNEAEKYGLEYAEFRSQFEYLDEMTKVILAELCREDIDLPVNRREVVARSSPIYKNHLEAVRDVRRLQLIAEAKRTKHTNEFERLRSKLSAMKIRDRF